MKYHAKLNPAEFATGWAVFLDDKQLTPYMFNEKFAKRLALDKKEQMEEIMEKALLEDPIDETT